MHIDGDGDMPEDGAHSVGAMHHAANAAHALLNSLAKERHICPECLSVFVAGRLLGEAMFAAMPAGASDRILTAKAEPLTEAVMAVAVRTYHAMLMDDGRVPGRPVSVRMVPIE